MEILWINFDLKGTLGVIWSNILLKVCLILKICQLLRTLPSSVLKISKDGDFPGPLVNPFQCLATQFALFPLKSNQNLFCCNLRLWPLVISLCFYEKSLVLSVFPPLGTRRLQLETLVAFSSWDWRSTASSAVSHASCAPSPFWWLSLDSLLFISSVGVFVWVFFFVSECSKMSLQLEMQL